MKQITWFIKPQLFTESGKNSEKFFPLLFVGDFYGYQVQHCNVCE